MKCSQENEMLGTITYVFVNLDHVTHMTEGLVNGSVLHFSGQAKDTLKVKETPETIAKTGNMPPPRTAGLVKVEPDKRSANSVLGARR